MVFLSVSIIAILVLIGLAGSVYNNYSLPEKARKGFFRITILLSFAIVISFLSVYTDNDERVPHILRVFFTFAEFSLTPIVSLVMAASFVQEMKLLDKVVHALAAINIIMLTLSLKFGFIFSIDKYNHYERGDLYFIYMAIYSVTALYLIFKLFELGKSYQYTNVNEIWMMVIILFFGVIVQAVNSEVKMGWLSCSIVAVFIYCYYSNVITQIDPLTGILNRQSFNHISQKKLYPLGILIIDLNKFKEVNDNFGHAEGDTCLKITARGIQNTYRKIGRCFRTGGDEFCVIIYRRHGEIEKYNESLRSFLDKEREDNPHVTTVSIGFAVANNKEEFDEKYNEADKLMYEDKKRQHAVRK